MSKSSPARDRAAQIAHALEQARYCAMHAEDTSLTDAVLHLIDAVELLEADFVEAKQASRPAASEVSG